jgi:hypothetical protein
MLACVPFCHRVQAVPIVIWCCTYAHAPLLQRVLLCGWGEHQFMGDLLAELDHGPSALPPGSSVTLLNSRPTAHIMSAPAGVPMSSCNPKTGLRKAPWSSFVHEAVYLMQRLEHKLRLYSYLTMQALLWPLRLAAKSRG